MIEQINLSDPAVLKKYTTHWENKEEEWKAIINNPNIGVAHFKVYKNIQNINRNFSPLSDLISNLNTLNRELITENDFQVIRKAIDEKMRGN